MRKLGFDPIAWLWLAWLLYWGAAAMRTKRTLVREPPRSRLAHTLPLMVAAILLVMNRPDAWLGGAVVPVEPRLRGAIGIALVAIGLGFAVWARVHLAGNWSGTVTVKEQHELIRSGPYRLVRHPIYSGMLLALVGTALAQDQWRSVIAFAIVWLAFWRKWSVEERFMRETFGDAYVAYRARVPAIVPVRWTLPR